MEDSISSQIKPTAWKHLREGWQRFTNRLHPRVFPMERLQEVHSKIKNSLDTSLENLNKCSCSVQDDTNDLCTSLRTMQNTVGKCDALNKLLAENIDKYLDYKVTGIMSALCCKPAEEWGKRKQELFEELKQYVHPQLLLEDIFKSPGYNYTKKIKTILQDTYNWYNEQNKNSNSDKKRVRVQKLDYERGVLSWRKPMEDVQKTIYKIKAKLLDLNTRINLHSMDKIKKIVDVTSQFHLRFKAFNEQLETMIKNVAPNATMADSTELQRALDLQKNIDLSNKEIEKFFNKTITSNDNGFHKIIKNLKNEVQKLCHQQYTDITNDISDGMIHILDQLEKQEPQRTPRGQELQGTPVEAIMPPLKGEKLQEVAKEQGHQTPTERQERGEVLKEQEFHERSVENTMPPLLVIKILPPPAYITPCIDIDKLELELKLEQQKQNAGKTSITEIK